MKVVVRILYMLMNEAKIYRAAQKNGVTLLYGL